MKEPIIIYEERDLTVYDTRAAAELDIEVPDVDAYEIFDAGGRRLRAVVQPDGLHVGLVEVGNASAKHGPKRLREILERELEVPPGRPLSELVAQAQQKFRYL